MQAAKQTERAASVEKARLVSSASSSKWQNMVLKSKKIADKVALRAEERSERITELKSLRDMKHQRAL